MRDEFKAYYQSEHKIGLNNLVIVRFGLEPLERLEALQLSREECKSALNLPLDRKSVCLGYNAFPGQQHIDILESFRRHQDALSDRIHLVVPMTYGGDDRYKAKVSRMLHSTRYRFSVLSNFMNDREIAMLRKASDYFINLQITDQLSGSMLEHLYAGSNVLTGSWLPYGVLDELGVTLLKVDDVSGAAEKIAKHLMNGSGSKKSMNSEIIYEFSYWGNCIRSWNELYKVSQMRRDTAQKQQHMI